MDAVRFESALARVTGSGREVKGIGTLSEKTLHAVLKLYFEPDASGHEVKIGSYIADIVGENGIVEVQTQGFDKLRKKLEVFLSVSKVTVVYPITRIKYINCVDPGTGEVSIRRKSPKHGTACHSFFELYKIKKLLTHPNLIICLILLDMEEYRWLNGQRSGKRRGALRIECVPIALAQELYISSPEDYALLIPEGLTSGFTTRDFAREAHIALKEAQTAVNVLCHVGVLRKIGRSGRFFLYVINE